MVGVTLLLCGEGRNPGRHSGLAGRAHPELSACVSPPPEEVLLRRVNGQLGWGGDGGEGVWASIVAELLAAANGGPASSREL